jgi:hypothetical protein
MIALKKIGVLKIGVIIVAVTKIGPARRCDFPYSGFGSQWAIVDSLPSRKSGPKKTDQNRPKPTNHQENG